MFYLFKVKCNPLSSTNMPESHLKFRCRDADFEVKAQHSEQAYMYHMSCVHFEISLPKKMKLLKLNAPVALSNASVQYSLLLEMNNYSF